MFTAGSLFSGIGGLDLAATMAGFDVLFHVEIDEFCRKVLAKHAPQYWPHAKQFTDVRQVGKHNLPEVDILYGGFPCQDVSLAGKRDGIREGTRSGLWFEFRRVISELRPSVVLLENVPGILTRDGIIVIADLAALGYVGRWGIISASDVGAPHQRERWFCVAYAQHNGHLTTAFKRSDGAPVRYNTQGQDGTGELAGIGTREFVADTDASGLQKPIETEQRADQTKNRTGVDYRPERSGYSGQQHRNAQPRLGGFNDGLPGGLDFPGFPARPGEDQYPYEPSRVTTIKQADRANRLKALGNAVVPYQVYPVLAALHEWLAGLTVEDVA